MSCENGKEIAFGQIFIPRRDRYKSLHVVTDTQAGNFVAASKLFRHRAAYGREVVMINPSGLFEPGDIGPSLGHMTLDDIIKAFNPDSYKATPPEDIIEALSKNALKPSRQKS